MDKLKFVLDKKIKKHCSQKYKMQAVAKMLDLEDDLPYQQQCNLIISHLNKIGKKNKQVKYLLENIDDKDTCDILINILYDMFNQDTLDDISIDITQKEYKNLIKKYQEKKITKKEKATLFKALNIKYCKCIKKLYLKDNYELLINGDKSNYNRYAVCINSIYKNRQIKPPKKISFSCKSKYNWYTEE